MGRYFGEDVLAEVASANDIVEVISSYIKVKREGKNYSALCPFHREKTPSFKIFPDSQRYKCFGCGASGNVFEFVKEMDRLSFPEAVELLARRGGVRIARSEKQAKDLAQRDICFELNREAKNHFLRNLHTDEGSIARDYIRTRGFTPETARKVGLGYSLDSWSALLDRLKAKGHSEEEVVGAGLALRSKRGSAYDRFRNRLMFPISDLQGRVVGFGARALGDDEVKYLNSPETPVFNKSTLLYGILSARKEMEDTGVAIVMEGYTDVIAAVQEGMTNCVATLGTALTARHLRLLSRFVKEVVFVFDGDEAGIKAAERSLPLCLEQEMDARVLELPDGTDPCDFIQKHGREVFVQLVADAPRIFDFVLSKLSATHDMDDPTEKIKACETLAGLVAQVKSDVHREVWASEAAQYLKIRPESLKTMIEGATTASSLRKKQRQDVDRSQVTTGYRHTPGWTVLGILLTFPSLAREFASKLTVFDETEDSAAPLLANVGDLCAKEEKEEEWDRTFWQTLQERETFILAERACEKVPDDEDKAREVMTRTLEIAARKKLRLEREKLKQQMLEAARDGDEWAYDELMRRYEELGNELKP
ncbi:MAG: DNA primase [Planctomycetota bacterium]|nr:DNA primase [Planctomycetota bacterium]